MKEKAMNTTLRLLIIVMLVALGPSSLAQTPNFAGEFFSVKLKPRQGQKNLLVVFWDPHRPEHPALLKQSLERMIFGPRPSVDDWFKENSGGRLRLQKAAAVGWYKAEKPADHYWNSKADLDSNDRDGDGWLNGHVEKWAEAIRKAARDFPLARYDINDDHVLTADELGILIVIPQKNPFGTNRRPAGREFPKWEPLIVDGIRIPTIAEVYIGNPPNLGIVAHELSHLFLDTPDLYMSGKWPFAPCDYCLMDHSYTSAHLNPFLKLKLGWLDLQVCTNAADIRLKAMEQNHQAAILYDPAHGFGEYFIFENRWRRNSYDAGVGTVCRGIPADGLAVWHILENPELFHLVNPPTGEIGEWGRRGIRLIRANGGEPIDDRLALFNQTNNSRFPLRWIDGSPSRFALEMMSAPGAEIRVNIHHE
jgi:M6 family metalloprotease-like protein